MVEPNDIVSRLNRILSVADERGLDETECRAIRDAAAEIRQLRKERDAARQDLCYIEAADRSTGDDAVPYTASLPKDIAEEWGWDCFKENTNDTN